MNVLPEHTLVLRLTDRPGAMESIAATFAHRGISLCWTLGNDGSTSPDGQALVIVHFRATVTHKEAVKRVLTRLTRIVSVTEPAADGTAVRLCALVRLQPDGTAPVLPVGASGHIDFVAQDPQSGEAIYSLTGPSEVIAPILSDLHRSGTARTITQVLLAL
ncbi:MAG: hypothetical protein SFU56_06360 [Capsulimonadales bacterium]|nr:hypothetical protein [Capsulimonadales bacterium]